MKWADITNEFDFLADAMRRRTIEERYRSVRRDMHVATWCRINPWSGFPAFVYAEASNYDPRGVYADYDFTS